MCESCGDEIDIENESNFCEDCLEDQDITDENIQEVEGKDESNLKNDQTQTAHCESCKGTNLHFVEIHLEKQLVCKDCGRMCSEFQQDENIEFHQFISEKTRKKLMNLPKYSNTVMETQGFLSGTKMIEMVCSKLKLESIIQEDSKALFEKAYNKFIRCSIALKENLGMVSVYISARKENIPISLEHFKQFSNNFTLFVKAKKKMVRGLGLTISSGFSISAEIKQVLQGKGLDHLITKVRDVLFLSRKAWLSQGRNTHSVITVGVYYAYLNSYQCKKYIGLKKFQKQFQLPSVSPALFSSSNTFFMKLAKEIPWANSERIHPRNFHTYLDDIIKFQNSLIHFAYQAEESLFLESSSDLPTKKKRDCDRTEMLPPCMWKKKRYQEPVLVSRIPTNIDLDSSELGESEFADEIDSYILTEEEEKELAPLKMKNWE